MTYNGQSMVSPEESSTTIGNLELTGERLISRSCGRTGGVDGNTR